MDVKVRVLPLSAEEKKKLRFILKARIIIGLFFMFLLIPAIGFASLNVIYDIIKGTSDGATYFIAAFASFVIFLIIRFVIPFYRNSFKNLRRKDKLVVDTVVLAIDQRTTSKGQKYSIQTSYRYLDPWAISTIMKPSLPFHEMRVNMLITIHCFEDNKIDILYIEKTDLKNRLNIL